MLGSVLPSRLTFVLAAFISEVPDGKSGENEENTNLSLESFDKYTPCWRNATLVITDDGVVYKNLH